MAGSKYAFEEFDNYECFFSKNVHQGSPLGLTISITVKAKFFL